MQSSECLQKMFGKPPSNPRTASSSSGWTGTDWLLPMVGRERRQDVGTFWAEGCRKMQKATAKILGAVQSSGSKLYFIDRLLKSVLILYNQIAYTVWLTLFDRKRSSCKATSGKPMPDCISTKRKNLQFGLRKGALEKGSTVVNLKQIRDLPCPG